MNEAKITHIEIFYSDGSRIELNSYEIEKFLKLEEVVSMLERARNVFQNLKPLFETGKKP